MATEKLDGKSINKFVNPLPNLLTPGLYIDATAGGNYEITMSQGLHDFGLGAGFDPTFAWGYHSDDAPLWDTIELPNDVGLDYLGPTIVAKEDVPISVQWFNNLPDNHLLNADDTPHGAKESLNGGVHVQPHVHGGLTAASSDGNPFANNAFLGTEIYNYRNAQDPATIWYHDHALGITRLNVYAGLAGFYIIRDDQDTGVADNPNTEVYDGNPLGLPANFDPGTPDNPNDDLNYEFPIVIQDKTFDTAGNLYYPAFTGDPLAGPGNQTVPAVPGVDAFGTVNPFPGGANEPTVVAEYGGDVMVVNGVAWPTLDVEPRTYRFRFLNGSDSRFYTLKLPGGVDFQVIGSDNGLLDGPAVATRNLPIGPGERYDVIVDFSGQEGKTLTLRNEQGGTGARPVFNDPQTSGQIMQFNVLDVKPSIPDPVDPKWQDDLRTDTIPVWTKNADGSWSSDIDLDGDGNPETTTDAGDHALAIFEGLDDYGRLFPHLGTVEEGSLLWAEDPDTGKLVEGDQPGNPGVGFSKAAEAETVTAGEYTLFEIYNTTPDSHPIHLHGTEFQVLERQKIQFTLLEEATYTDPNYDPLTNPNADPPPAYLTSKFADTNNNGIAYDDITLLGKATPAAAFESGFKDTAIVKPGERVVVVAKYDEALLQADAGFGGAGNYVWHCHILSHEDHEMMRPLKLTESDNPIVEPPPVDII